MASLILLSFGPLLSPEAREALGPGESSRSDPSCFFVNREEDGDPSDVEIGSCFQVVRNSKRA